MPRDSQAPSVEERLAPGTEGWVLAQEVAKLDTMSAIILRVALAEIARLREELAQAREALEEIADATAHGMTNAPTPVASWYREYQRWAAPYIDGVDAIARRALSPREGGDRAPERGGA